VRRGSRGSLNVSLSQTTAGGLTTKHLVSPLSTQHHLDTHRLDLPTKQVHGRRRSDCRHIECLEVVNDLGNGVETFLDSEGVFVVDCAEEVCCFARGNQIGRSDKTNGEGVEGGP
jgi:hypothetical protein